MIALEERVQPRDAEYLFSPLVSTMVVVGAGVVFALVCLSTQGERTVLLTPLDTRLQATLIAAGVFVGVWVAAVVREFWQLGIRLGGPVPEGIAVAAKLVVLVAAGGWCGFMLAYRSTEWCAFHDLQPSATWESFTVAGFTTHRRGARSLNLIATAGAPAIAIGCDVQDCRNMRVGDLLLVTVETGRDGVRRAVFPGTVGERRARN